MAKKLLTSPRGTAVYPHLNQPDTRFKAEGQYKIGLRLESEDPATQKFCQAIDAAMAQAVATAREDNKDNPKVLKKVKPCEDKPYKIELDDDDNETGYTVFNFKMTASGMSKKTGKPFTMKPALFDGQGEPLDAETKVGGGSIVRVSYEIAEFFVAKIGAGVSLRLSGVQVIKLVEWGVGNAASHGFTPVEDEMEDEDGEDEEEEQSAPVAKKKSKPFVPAPVDEDDDEDEDADDDF